MKEKPIELSTVTIQLDKGSEIHNPVLVTGFRIFKQFGNQVLLDDVDFQLLNHSRTALIGPNGSGKTTLLKMILNEENGIRLAKNVRFGYFSQSLDLLDETKTILENVMEKSTKEESFVRMLLARLLFKGEEVFKLVSVLSGGEKNKVSLALLLVSDANVLILDEPTNYLDIASIEAVETALVGYEGTLLFVSHDEQFVKNVATHIWQIQNQTLISKEAGAEILSNAPKKESSETKEKLMVLENRLNAVIAQLSIRSVKDPSDPLEKEYSQLLQQIKLLKER